MSARTQKTMLECTANSDSLAGNASHRLAADLLMLAKAGLTCLVLLTTSVGFYMASPRFDPVLFAATLLGTALLAGGAQALNQVMESDQDALMKRTRNRPVPQGRIGKSWAMGLGIMAGLMGTAILGGIVNCQSAILGGITLVLYLGAYTPLKRISPICTFIGATAGAIPPVLGGIAARPGLETSSVILFGILFFWQIPHFLAIAWMYREDYLRAGLKVLPARDENGLGTGIVSMGGTIALSIVACIRLGAGSSILCRIGIGACVAGMLACALRFLRERNRTNARGLFLCSIVVLPLVLLFVMWT